MNIKIKKAKSNKFVIYNDGYGCNINVIITNGELSCVAHAGTRSEYTHDLKEHPNWKHAKEMLKSISEENREEFLNIVKLLKKDSKGYAIIKEIARLQICKYEDKISMLKKESEFWQSF